MEGVELLLVNAQHVKNRPGHKTDVQDACWLTQLPEYGLLQGSFIPTLVMARLRMIEQRSQETQRVQKLLEDAGIKLDSVVSDVLGKSGRSMLDALITGERDPEVMAEMALTRMRPKIGKLRLGLEGRFNDHHALMLNMHLQHLDHLTALIERLDAEVERELVPFAEQVRQLWTIPGLGQRTAEVVIAEKGVDPSHFPSAGHLASWAGRCPGNNQSRRLVFQLEKIGRRVVLEGAA